MTRTYGIFTAAGILWACAAHGAILTVSPDGTRDYTTIQAAIDAASAGDTVLVGPGVYRDTSVRTIAGIGRGANVFLKNGVAVRGSGPGRSVIEADDRTYDIDAAVVAVDVEGAFLKGFTLRGAIDWGEPHYQFFGRALLAERSSLSICGNVFDSYIVKPGEPERSGCQFFGVIVTLRDCDALVANNLFIYADDTHVNLAGGTLRLFHNTFLGDPERPEPEGYGVCVERGECSAWNNIFAYVDVAFYLYARKGNTGGGVLHVSHSDYWSIAGRVQCDDPAAILDDRGGHLEADPRFVLLDLPVGRYDVSLLPDSPCIDAGAGLPAWALPAVDLYGRERVADGDADGRRVGDIGAAEFVPAAGTSSVSGPLVLDMRAAVAEPPDAVGIWMRSCIGKLPPATCLSLVDFLRKTRSPVPVMIADEDGDGVREWIPFIDMSKIGNGTSPGWDPTPGRLTAEVAAWYAAGMR